MSALIIFDCEMMEVRANGLRSRQVLRPRIAQVASLLRLACVFSMVYLNRDNLFQLLDAHIKFCVPSQSEVIGVVEFFFFRRKTHTRGLRRAVRLSSLLQLLLGSGSELHNSMNQIQCSLQSFAINLNSSIFNESIQG